MNAKRHRLIVTALAVASTAWVAQAAPDKPMTMNEAKTWAIFAPRPEYPLEAQQKKLTGSGEGRDGGQSLLLTIAIGFDDFGRWRGRYESNMLGRVTI